MTNFNSLSFYIPELIIIVAIISTIVFDLIPKTREYTFYLCIGLLLFSGVALYGTYGIINSLFMGMICIDPFSHYFKYISFK